MVDTDYDGAPACSCHDFMCRERECKHIRFLRECGIIKSKPHETQTQTEKRVFQLLPPNRFKRELPHLRADQATSQTHSRPDCVPRQGQEDHPLQ